MITFAPWIADVRGAWGAVDGTDKQQIQFGIVGDAVPHSAAAATLLPPVPTPCLAGHLHLLVLEGPMRSHGHGVPAPEQFAAQRIVGRHVTAHAEFGAALSDEHHPSHDTWCAGDRVPCGLV